MQYFAKAYKPEHLICWQTHLLENTFWGSVSDPCHAHLLAFCLVWLLCCPTLCALVHFVLCSTNLRWFRLVCVALWAHRARGLACLGRCTVHLKAPQLTALETALIHNSTWPPCIGAIACWLTCVTKWFRIREWTQRTYRLSTCL